MKGLNFYDDFGLIAANKTDGNAENNILFTAEYYYLTKDIHTQFVLIHALNLMKESSGIYRQHPAPMTGDWAYMSHDQLTTICSLSKYLGLSHHKDLWKEIKRQKFAYCNVHPNDSWWSKVKNGRLVHPRDILYIGYINDSIICKTLSPLLFLILGLAMFSTWKIRPEWYNLLYYKWKGITNYYKCKIPSMDGKLLNFVRCQGIMNTSIIWRLFYHFVCWRISTKYGSWFQAFSLYFHDEDHPNNIASKNI